MSRRSIDRRQYLAATTAAVGSLVGCAGWRDAASTDGPDVYHNPVYEPIAADPAVVRDDHGIFYVFHTHSTGPILRSPNLIDWEAVGTVFDRLPTWVRDGALWAPGVTEYGGTYYYYYTLAGNRWSVGLATADHPTGEWTDHGEVLDPSFSPSIDAQPFVDDGTLYLLWRHGPANAISIAELADDGTTLAGEPTQVTGPPFEEAPYVVERDDTYWLFVSAGNCCAGAESTYRVQVARADSLTGPYRNAGGEDLRDTQGTTVLEAGNGFTGPGHNSVIRDDAGDWWMVYHAYENGPPDVSGDGRGYVEQTPAWRHASHWRRTLAIDPIRWEDGWPVVGAGVPSREQRAPVVDVGPYREVAVEDVAVSPTLLSAGDELTATATVENTGDAGVARLYLFFDGDRVASRSVVVGAGERKTVSMSTRLYDGADYTVTMGPSADAAPPGQSITFEPRPATLQYYQLRARARVADAGDTVPVTVDVQNVGSESTTEQIALRESGRTVTTAEVSLDPGELTTPTFEAALGDPAVREFAVGDLDPVSVWALGPAPDRYETFANADATFGTLGDRAVVAAAGNDTWRGVDSYGAFYEPGGLGPRGTVVARLDRMAWVRRWSKAGIMIRNDVAAPGTSAGYANLVVTDRGSSYQFEWDSDGNGYIDGGPVEGSVAYPAWLKVDRDGATVTGYRSDDGESWTEIAATELPKAAERQDVGLYATSTVPGVLTPAAFGTFRIADE